MKKVFVIIGFLAICSGYAQEKISGNLKLAVKDEKEKNNLTTPDLSYYSKHYNEVFRDYNYTFDIMDTSFNRLYVEGDKFYSNTYVPIVLQQHNTNLAVNNVYFDTNAYRNPITTTVPIKK